MLPTVKALTNKKTLLDIDIDTLKNLTHSYLRLGMDEYVEKIDFGNPDSRVVTYCYDEKGEKVYSNKFLSTRNYKSVLKEAKLFYFYIKEENGLYSLYLDRLMYVRLIKDTLPVQVSNVPLALKKWVKVGEFKKVLNYEDTIDSLSKFTYCSPIEKLAIIQGYKAYQAITKLKVIIWKLDFLPEAIRKELMNFFNALINLNIKEADRIHSVLNLKRLEFKIKLGLQQFLDTVIFWGITIFPTYDLLRLFKSNFAYKAIDRITIKELKRRGIHYQKPIPKGKIRDLAKIVYMSNKQLESVKVRILSNY